MEKTGNTLRYISYKMPKVINKNFITTKLIEYFNKYEAFCFDLNSDSVLKGDLNFNYK